MKFDDLEAKMRIFEIATETFVLPGIYMAARIDGRNFTRLTRELHPFEAPYDIQFRDYMVTTVEHLMQCGFRVIYGYTQSDEISLLFHREETAFERRLHKLHSILAGEASAKFSLQLGVPAAFDCRISQLPNEDLVVDYFRWRSEDAHRNALNGHCFWMLRKQGKTVDQATKALLNLSVSAKNELLFKNGINFNDLPNWQKRGVGLYWESYERYGLNPNTNERVKTERRRIRVDYDLPMKDAYGDFIRNLLIPSVLSDG